MGEIRIVGPSKTRGFPYPCVCVPILVTTFPSGSAVRNHCRIHPAPCVRPRFVCSVLRAHAQLCRFDKAEATADVQWHCNHRPPLWYHYFPAQSSLGANILVYWIGKIVRTLAPGGSRTLDFLRARRAPYPLGQAIRISLSGMQERIYRYRWHTRISLSGEQEISCSSSSFV